MERTECTERILDAKAAKGLTFAEIGGKIGRSEVWTTAAIFGQAQMDAPRPPASVTSSASSRTWRSPSRPTPCGDPSTPPSPSTR